MEVFHETYSLVLKVDKRMTEKLRTHVFGSYRAVLLLVLNLPLNSGFRSEVSDYAGRHINSVMAVLSENLDLTGDPREIHVVLFELASLIHEFPVVDETRPRSEAFIEGAETTLPLLSSRLATSTSPSSHELSLVNAELIFLSKISAPMHKIRAGQLLSDQPPNQEIVYSLVTRTLEILVESGLFGVIVKQWPLEDDLAVKRMRALQPTVRLGLNLVLNILSRHREYTVIQETIRRLFEQHLEEFQTALKMGSTRSIVDGDWKPDKSDQEIAQLIDKLIHNSIVKTTPEVFSQVAQLCPSFHARLRP